MGRRDAFAYSHIELGNECQYGHENCHQSSPWKPIFPINIARLEQQTIKAAPVRGMMPVIEAPRAGTDFLSSNRSPPSFFWHFSKALSEWHVPVVPAFYLKVSALCAGAVRNLVPRMCRRLIRAGTGPSRRPWHQTLSQHFHVPL